MPLYVLERFSTPEEAHLLRARLESVGIPAYVQDENFVQMHWLYSNAIGGVRLEIAEEDLERAREFLLAPEPDETQAASLEEEAGPTVPWAPCPQCGSEATKENPYPRRWSFLSVLLLHLPLPVSQHHRECRDCGHKWRER